MNSRPLTHSSSAIDRHANSLTVDPEIRKAAQGLEAMFLDYMMKVMRQTIPKNEFDLKSPATEIYQGMLDAETSEVAARTGGIGLADQIVAYLQAQRYTQKRGPLPPYEGGPHEGE